MEGGGTAHLLADSARQHERRDVVVREDEAVGALFVVLKYVHVDEVLHVALLDGDKKLFLK